ncbi:MAG: hypothetical protein LBR61_00185, partial [Synergistaceae bacterium]|nr:hypothetical protein [Synergistaceae bacterium]
DNYGTINNDGTILIDGLFTNQPDGTVNNNTGALIHITDGGTLDNHGTLNNDGTILVDGHFHNESDGTVNNKPGGIIKVTDGGVFDNDGSLINDGTIRVNDGGVFNNNTGGTLDDTNGNIDVADGGVFNDRGTVIGDGNSPSSSPSPSPSPSPSGPDRSSTDVTCGLVRLTNNAGTMISEGYMIRQGDGTWLITAPAGTDLFRVGLTFILPDAGASVSPGGGEIRDFSGGQAVLYTVTSADGKNETTYPVRLDVRDLPVLNGTLVDPDPARWSLSQSQNADGTYSFTVEAPLAGGVFPDGPAYIYASLGGSYSCVTLVTTTSADGVPVLRITGTAQTLSDLQNLSISLIEWGLADGREYVQNLNPPATCFTIGVGGSVYDDASDGNDRNSKNDKKGGGGGCTTGTGFFLGLAALAPLLTEKKK